MAKSYKPEQFESRGFVIDKDGNQRKDTSANIYESMLLSEAFMDLNNRQKLLYIYCKKQYYGHKKPGEDYKDVEPFQGRDKFYLNWASIKAYGLYKDSMHSNFYNDMNALIDHGFIKRIGSGANQRKKSIYQFCYDWQLWNPVDGFG